VSIAGDDIVRKVTLVLMNNEWSFGNRREEEEIAFRFRMILIFF
jgi:hypothetical protein